MKVRFPRPFVFVIAGVAVLGVVFLMALLYEATTIECTRTRGTEGACVLTQQRVTGTSKRLIPSSAIRSASMSVGTSHRAGTSPGHTDTSMTIDLNDGTAIAIDDITVGFLDPSFERGDAQAIDRFIADKTIERTYARNGGVKSMFAIILGLAAFAASLVWLWGFAAIEITRGDGFLTVKCDEVTRHPLEGIESIGIDAAYRSLRVTYKDGKSEQTARIGISVAHLEELARRTRALVELT